VEELSLLAEQLSLMIGIVLMLVAAIGIVLYVALVIAIPVCRMLDWFSGEPAGERTTSPHASNVIKSAFKRLTDLGHAGRPDDGRDA
jgi:hypothetical protein